MGDTTEQRYLGDGVYASYDGWMVWLAVNNHENNVIALEPQVADALVTYLHMIRNKAIGLQESKATD